MFGLPALLGRALELRREVNPPEARLKDRIVYIRSGPVSGRDEPFRFIGSLFGGFVDSIDRFAAAFAVRAINDPCVASVDAS